MSTEKSSTRLEKKSTEITSTRKKRPQGNKVHLQRVEKRSTKVGKLVHNTRLAFNFFTSNNALANVKESL